MLIGSPPNSWQASRTGTTMNSLRAFSLSKTCRVPRSSISRSHCGTGRGGSAGNTSAVSTLTPRAVDIVSSEKSV